MSVIVWMASTPDWLSSPCLTAPVARPAAAPREQVVALLAGVVDVEDAERGWIDGALRADRDRLPVLAEDEVAVGIDELVAALEAELAVARVADAAGGLDGEVAGAGDAEVERLARSGAAAWGWSR